MGMHVRVGVYVTFHSKVEEVKHYQVCTGKKAHLRDHTNEGKFCKHCGESFVDKSKVKKVDVSNNIFDDWGLDSDRLMQAPYPEDGPWQPVEMNEAFSMGSYEDGGQFEIITTGASAIEEFKNKYADYIAAFNEHGVEYSIKYGVVVSDYG